MSYFVVFLLVTIIGVVQARTADDWVDIMKIAPDAVFDYHSTHWFDANSTFDDGTNFKYAAFNTEPFQQLRACVRETNECLVFTLESVVMNAVELFSGPPRLDVGVDQEDFDRVFGVSGRQDCEPTWAGINIGCGNANHVRWGYCVNAPSKSCQTHGDSDGVIGLGISGQDCCPAGAGYTNYVVSDIPDNGKQQLYHATLSIKRVDLCPITNAACAFGTCDVNTGLCVCDQGYFGDKCDEDLCHENGLSCGVHGECNLYDGICSCDEGYFGDDCDQVVCYDDLCGIYGSCDGNNRCKCTHGRLGHNCEIDPCDLVDNCNGQGVCTNGTCECDDAFAGDSCDVDVCSDVDCGAHGSCKHGLCECTDNYMGDFCEDGSLINCNAVCTGQDGPCQHDSDFDTTCSPKVNNLCPAGTIDCTGVWTPTLVVTNATVPTPVREAYKCVECPFPSEGPCQNPYDYTCYARDISNSNLGCPHYTVDCEATQPVFIDFDEHVHTHKHWRHSTYGRHNILQEIEI